MCLPAAEFSSSFPFLRDTHAHTLTGLRPPSTSPGRLQPTVRNTILPPRQQQTTTKNPERTKFPGYHKDTQESLCFGDTKQVNWDPSCVRKLYGRRQDLERKDNTIHLGCWTCQSNNVNDQKKKKTNQSTGTPAAYEAVRSPTGPGEGGQCDSFWLLDCKV